VTQDYHGNLILNSLSFFQQEGSLCAQHCLNALLQGPYFSAVDLADIGRQLDESERQQMAEGGTETEGYQHFIKVHITQGLTFNIFSEAALFLQLLGFLLCNTV
jgi:hypothetical protein